MSVSTCTRDESTEVQLLTPSTGQRGLAGTWDFGWFDLPIPILQASFCSISLHPEDPTNARGADAGHKQRKYAGRVFYVLGRSELVGCGVRLGHQLPAASLQDESARAMPMPTNK